MNSNQGSGLKSLKKLGSKVKSRMRAFFNFPSEFCRLAIKGKSAIPLRYFSARPNVGDALNVYLVEKITGREVVEVKSGWLRHILGVGSIMHLANSRSVVWGSGIIEESQVPAGKIVKGMKFSALRGFKSRDVISGILNNKLSCPLGDPAVLMPLFYSPIVKKKYRLGVVPHYVDKEMAPFKRFLSQSGAKLIDVELPVEAFIRELLQCEVVVSSSLHGLILSDSYGIPNAWVKFSDKIIGGDFKFLDYYSTTDLDKPSPVDLSSVEYISEGLERLASSAEVAHFSQSKQLLLDAFPAGSLNG